MKHLRSAFAFSAFVGALALSTVASAQDTSWTADVINLDATPAAKETYRPLDKAQKAWRVCILFPHMKDSIWLAVDYGVVSEAKRLGIEADIYQAGGYENLTKQLSQFDDCMAGGYDAIILGAISEAGLSRKLSEAASEGIPVVAVLNPVSEAKIAAKIFADQTTMGKITGKYLTEETTDIKAKVVAFPGPAGSGWAEQFMNGFKEGIGGASNVELLEEKFGDTGVAVQLGLLQNALQAHPDMNVIWGGATTAEAAIGAVAEANRPNVTIMSSYENQATLDLLKSHKIVGFGTQFPVLQGRIAVDLAVRALQKSLKTTFVMAEPTVVSEANLSTIDMTQVLAPADFTAVYSVK